jgi:hypothetical protein
MRWTPTGDGPFETETPTVTVRFRNRNVSIRQLILAQVLMQASLPPSLRASVTSTNGT